MPAKSLLGPPKSVLKLIFFEDVFSSLWGRAKRRQYCCSNGESIVFPRFLENQKNSTLLAVLQQYFSSVGVPGSPKRQNLMKKCFRKVNSFLGLCDEALEHGRNRAHDLLRQPVPAEGRGLEGEADGEQVRARRGALAAGLDGREERRREVVREELRPNLAKAPPS